MADLSKELNKELSKDFAYCEDALGRAENAIGNLPSAQPEAIPVEWIDRHFEWLDNCDNDFAQLAKVMVELWKKDKI